MTILTTTASVQSKAWSSRARRLLFRMFPEPLPCASKWFNFSAKICDCKILLLLGTYGMCCQYLAGHWLWEQNLFSRSLDSECSYTVKA